MRFLNFILFGLCLLFTLPDAEAQNTKGDRPVGNQRQVSETKSKSYKRKQRGTSKDIAGRRLRTRGQSSANRANAQYRQPPTTSRTPKRTEERSAPPRGRTFTQAPREQRVRAWKGDVSGYSMRRMKPSGHDAARSNVYPQKGPYIRHVERKPKERPPVHKRTIKGERFVEHRPRAQERAWTGGLDHGPIRNQSATGTTRNTYSQRGPYVRYFSRRAKTKVPSFSNRAQVSKVKRYSRPPRTGGSQPRFYPSSGTQPYVQRGRKNVYWGKYQKKERPVTTDITGGPLRTRNYKSQPIGLVGRDSLEYFDRRPAEDRGKKPPSSGYRTTARASSGWRGDVAGWPVRSPRTQRYRQHQPLTPTQPGLGAVWLSKVFNYKFKGVKPKDRVPPTPEAKYTGNIPRGDRTKSFDQAGSGYSGNIKGARSGFNKTGAGYTGKSRRRSAHSRAFARYSGNLDREGQLGYSSAFLGYSGRMPRSALSEFSPSGFAYSGFIKRSQIKPFSKQGANYAGNQRRVRGFNTESAGYTGTMKRGARGMTRQGEGYAGNLRRGRGFDTGYMGYSGNLPRSAAAKQFEEVGYGYQGFIKQVKSFSDQGEGSLGKNKYRFGKGFTFDGAGFSGTVRAKRPAKGGGSISGMWNNEGSPLIKTPPASLAGGDFSGRTKAKRPAKGGGSVSGLLWNNEESPLGKTPPVSAGGADFSGRTKARRPLKGGGTVSGLLWNNQETALVKTQPASSGGADFSGRTKAQRPSKGGGSVSGLLWNNKESALAKSAPATANAPSGLQVRVKEGDYSPKKHASKESLPGIRPGKGSVKASEYSRSLKMYWNYKHNPSSSRYALKTTGPGKAEARIRDYQGNNRMRKYSVSGMHPDAKFAHTEDDNVKGERGLLTNVKLFWEKMFNKGGTQPTSAKDKGKKLQYDKREKGLWAY